MFAAYLVLALRSMVVLWGALMSGKAKARANERRRREKNKNRPNLLLVTKSAMLHSNAV